MFSQRNNPYCELLSKSKIQIAKSVFTIREILDGNWGYIGWVLIE